MNEFAVQDSEHPEYIPTIAETIHRLIYVATQINAYLDKIEPLEVEVDT